MVKHSQKTFASSFLKHRLERGPKKKKKKKKKRKEKAEQAFAKAFALHANAINNDRIKQTYECYQCFS